MIMTDWAKQALSFRKEIVKMEKEGWKAVSLYYHHEIKWNEKVVDIKLNNTGSHIFIKVEEKQL